MNEEWTDWIRERDRQHREDMKYGYPTFILDVEQKRWIPVNRSQYTMQQALKADKLQEAFRILVEFMKKHFDIEEIKDQVECKQVKITYYELR